MADWPLAFTIVGCAFAFASMILAISKLKD